MAVNEALVLDSLAINDGTTWDIDGSISMPPPNKRPEWISGADSNGALLMRDPLYDNRIIEVKLRVVQQSTKDLALAKIALLEDKLQECARQANGLALTWVPADATTSAVTFRCLMGEIVDMPIDVQDSGWMVKAPTITVKLTCLPFGEGTEAQIATVTSSAPIITLELTSIPGAVEATGRLVVLDAATQSRRYVAWGLESRYYPTSSPPSLIVDSSTMLTSGYAGTTVTLTGAYSSATNNAISVSTLPTQVTAVCGLPAVLSHVGTFRVHMRCYTNATGNATSPYVRLTYQTLDGPFRSLPYVQLPVTGFNDVDLGLITIPETSLGTQKWTGRIEAYDPAATYSMNVDALWLVPAEQYGKARAVAGYQTGAIAGYDNFTSVTATTVLNARAAPLGGSWVTSGGATDIAAVDAPVSTDETMARATVSDGAFPANARHARLGASITGAVEAGCDVRFTLPSYAIGYGVLARWVDASNFVVFGSLTGSDSPGIYIYVAGVSTARWDFTTMMADNAWSRLRFVVYPSGVATGYLLDTNNGVIETGSLTNTALATGGTLANGRPGILDWSNEPTVVTRYYDNFYFGVPAAEPIVCFSGQSIEVRSSETLRKDSTGTYAGPPPEYTGSRFTVPCAGGPARKSRIAVIARRLDVEASNDDTLTSNVTTDSTTVTAFATGRYLAVPR
jgi:hypothetical protein